MGSILDITLARQRLRKGEREKERDVLEKASTIRGGKLYE